MAHTNPILADIMQASAASAPLLTERSDEDIAARRYEIKEELARLNKEIDELKAERGEIDLEITSRLEARGATSFGTEEFTVSMRTEPMYPQAIDRERLERYILGENALYLLQFRLSTSAIQEIYANGGEIPGIQMVERKVINQRKKPAKKGALLD